MIKAIVFDFGDVLSRGVTISILEKFRDQIDMEPEEVMARIRKSKEFDLAMRGKMSYDDYITQLSDILDIDRKTWKKILKNMVDSRKLDEDVMRIVKRLRKRYKLAILSDHIKGVFDDYVKKLKLADHFDYILYSAKIGSMKIDGKMFKIMLDDLKLKADECVFVDDLEPNIEVAKSLGFKTIHFKNATQLEEELNKLGVEF